MLTVYLGNTEKLKAEQFITIINDCNVDLSPELNDSVLKFYSMSGFNALQLQFNDRRKSTFVSIDPKEYARFRYSYKNEGLKYVDG